MDGRALQGEARGGVLRLRLPCRLQDGHRAEGCRLRCEIHERRPFGLEGRRRAARQADDMKNETASVSRAAMLLLSRADVERLLTPAACIAAVEDAFRQLALGKVPAPAILGMH